MNIGKMLLNWGPILRIRRNHALEHATLQILAQQNKASRLAGLSGTFGFWVIGQVDSEDLIQAAQEARKRLMSGEHSLAIHPNCGTNFVTSGIIGGLFAWLATLSMPKTWRDRVDRLPNIISLVTIGLIFAQPLGPKMQEWVTTESQLGSLHLTEVQRFMERNPPAHRVLTSD
ncbi:MAG: hypothetical protein BGO78_05600 [Chloroflexi bacterium 44-23]|nr:MAG: hypothetical protein BGO78_05600 [Chloroflexi bacterium 44-23]